MKLVIILTVTLLIMSISTKRHHRSSRSTNNPFNIDNDHWNGYGIAGHTKIETHITQISLMTEKECKDKAAQIENNPKNAIVEYSKNIYKNLNWFLKAGLYKNDQYPGFKLMNKFIDTIDTITNKKYTSKRNLYRAAFSDNYFEASSCFKNSAYLSTSTNLQVVTNKFLVSKTKLFVVIPRSDVTIGSNIKETVDPDVEDESEVLLNRGQRWRILYVAQIPKKLNHGSESEGNSASLNIKVALNKAKKAFESFIGNKDDKYDVIKNKAGSSRKRAGNVVFKNERFGTELRFKSVGNHDSESENESEIFDVIFVTNVTDDEYKTKCNEKSFLI